MASRFNPIDFFLLRAPRLPSCTLSKLNCFERKEELWEYIRTSLKDPELLDAIYIASDSLFEQFVLHRDLQYTPKIDKLLAALFKYFSRMSSRATPYGKFSGVCMGQVSGRESRLQLTGLFVPHYRLDMECMAHLVDGTLKKSSSRDNLLYFTNSTLVETYGKYRYIDFENRNTRRSYHWAWITKNPILDEVLSIGKTGCKYSCLLKILYNIGIERDKAQNYLNGLIEAKLLISELEFTGVGVSAENLLSKLTSLEKDIEAAGLFESLERSVGRLNSKNENCYSFSLHTDTIDLKGPEVKTYFKLIYDWIRPLIRSVGGSFPN